ncbi:MAG TPA: hypothetical protein VJ861_00625 [Treponemataceae bacterium]|nr:hypothetical protein [Treponemataceae bacterium]
MPGNKGYGFLFAGFLFLQLIACAIPIAANPFTSSGETEPGAIRTSQTDATLVSAQGKLREELGRAFFKSKNNGSGIFFSGILGIAFLYGLVHALGPGHRKTIVFSLFLAKKARAWEPLGTGLVLSFLHGGSSVVIMLIFRGVTGAISGKTDIVTRYMEGLSYIVLIIVALFLSVLSLRDLFPSNSVSDKPRKIGIGALFLSGLYPCPGAILVLILALTLNRMWTGVFAVFSMSLGMSIPIIFSGYLAWFGRTGLFFGLKKKEAALGRISSSVELLSYLLLLCFSLYMALPFILSFFR